VTSQTLIVLKNVLGLENRAKWTCELNRRSGESHESRTVVVRLS